MPPSWTTSHINIMPGDSCGDNAVLHFLVLVNFSVKPAKSEVVDPELVIGVSTGRNHMESEPVFGYREESMKR